MGKTRKGPDAQGWFAVEFPTLPRSTLHAPRSTLYAPRVPPAPPSRLASSYTALIVAPMRPVRALGLYIFLVFIGGALLAPFLFWFVQLLGSSFPHLATSPFHRYVTRSFLIVAVAGLWPLLRSLGAKSWSDLGIVAPAHYFKNIGEGFILGFISLAVVALAAIAAGARGPTANHYHLAQKLFSALLSAIAVGVLEEILFRGGIFGALRKTMPWRAALIISSSIYALVHFLGNPRASGPVLWYSGLALLPRMLDGFFHLQQLVPGFFNLMMAGAILAFAYYRTGNLYLSIGLHSGWIFWLKSYGALTRELPGANIWLWGGSKLIDGWFALPILTATLLCLVYMPLRTDPIRKNSTAPKVGPTVTG